MASNRLKIFLLFLGDVAILYASLLIALILRYEKDFWGQFLNYHLLPFTIVFVVWIAIFYIAGLYDLRRLRNNLDFLKTLFLSLFTNAIATVFLFYLIPALGITPKTNLFVFFIIFSAVETLWRRIFNATVSSGEAPNKLILVGNTSTADAVCEIISQNPQLGYEVKKILNEEEAYSAPHALRELVAENGANLIVVPRHFKNHARIAGSLYELLGSGVEVRDLTNFYELIARKVPLADLEEAWFLENLIGQKKFYDGLKRAWEFFAALIIFVALLPLEALIAIITAISSPGPAIYKQIRVGQDGKNFTFYKFRTMRTDAEKDGVKWSDPKNDSRVTFFGKFLRHTHLDELPQLINIMRGELSFVGPRPERPEFVKTLKEEVPYYEIRLLVKPGITGWAQINYRKDTTAEDVGEKLQYDIYYVKNRSIVLDLAIILKTIKTLFVSPK